MDKKSKMLFGVFALLIILSIAVTYYRTMVTRDFSVEESSDAEILE